MLKAAEKILRRFTKTYCALCEKEGYVCKTGNEENYKMYKELQKLNIDVDIKYDNFNRKFVQLSLASAGQKL